MTRDMTKGARFSFYLMLFLMGVTFWVTSMTGHFSMNAGVYGWVASYPSELWAGGMFFPTSIYLIALFINGKRPWTAPARCLLGLGMMAYFATFSLSAMETRDGGVVVIVSAWLMIKASMMLAFDGMDLLRRWHGTR